MNETTVEIKLPEGSELTAEDLAGKQITLTAGEETVTATFVTGTFASDAAKFKLDNGAKLTDAAEYTATADWATITNPTFIAKVVAAYAKEFVVTTAVLKADEAGKEAVAKKVYFKALNQYGEEITLANANGLKVEVKKGKFPVATTNLTKDSFVITEALLDSETVTVTITSSNTEGKVIGTGSATLTASADVAAYSGVSDIKVSKGIDGTTTNLKLDDLKAGDKFEVSASALDGAGNPDTTKNLRWTTSDSSILALKDATESKPYVDDKKVELIAVKEGTATITAYTLDGKFSKEFTVTVGKGKLATISTDSITGLEVVNKVTTENANIVVNKATTGANAVTKFVKFTNANNTAIPVKADDLTFTVVAPTGFEATDVTVEKVVDADGYLTGLKVSSDRSKLTDAEKIGNYGTGLNYTVKVASADKAIAEKQFTVTSKIDSKVASIETAATAEFRQGSSVEQAITFKNAKGEVLNVKNDAALKKTTEGVTVAYLTTNKDGKFVAAAANDVVTGIKLTGTKGKGTAVISVGVVDAKVNATITDAATIATINAGNDITSGVIATKEEILIKPISVFDQDSKALEIAPNKLSVTAKAGEDTAPVDAFTINYYKTDKKTGKLVVADVGTKEGIALFINQSKFINEAEAVTYAVEVAEINAEKEAANLVKDSVSVKVDKAPAVEKVTVTAKADKIVEGGTTELHIIPTDQYGEFFKYTDLNSAKARIAVTPSKTGVVTANIADLAELKASEVDSTIVAGSAKDVVVGYKLEVTGVKEDSVNLDVTVNNGKSGAELKEVKAAQAITVGTIASLVDSVVIEPKEGLQQAGTKGVQLKATALDADKNEVVVDPKTLTWTIEGVNYNGKALKGTFNSDKTTFTINDNDAGLTGVVLTISGGKITSTVDSLKGLTVDVAVKVETANFKEATTTVTIGDKTTELTSGFAVAKAYDGAATDEEKEVEVTGNAGEISDISKKLTFTFTGVDQYGTEFDIKDLPSTGAVTVSSDNDLAVTIDSTSSVSTLTVEALSTKGGEIYINHKGQKLTIKVTVAGEAKAEIEKTLKQN